MKWRRRFEVVALGTSGSAISQRTVISEHRSEREAREAAGLERRRLEVIRAEEAASWSIQVVRGDEIERLPDSPNAIFMAARKFGSTGQPSLTWTTNALLPGLVARRYARTRHWLVLPDAIRLVHVLASKSIPAAAPTQRAWQQRRAARAPNRVRAMPHAHARPFALHPAVFLPPGHTRPMHRGDVFRQLSAPVVPTRNESLRRANLVQYCVTGQPQRVHRCVLAFVSQTKPFRVRGAWLQKTRRCA